MKLHHDVDAVAGRLPNLLERLDRCFRLVSGGYSGRRFPDCWIELATRWEKVPALEQIGPDHFVSRHPARELSLRGVARSTV